MAEAQKTYRGVLSRLESKDKKGTSIEDAYDALSFLPGTGEAIAAYELPEVLSQSGKMISSDDFVEAAKGTGLATLGIASMLPIVGPAAKAAKKGLEGFIPYLGPKTAVAGGPDIDPNIMKMEGGTSGVSAVPDDLNLGSGSLFSPEVKKGRKLLIVSCSADKCPDPDDMEAFDRYTGDMFKSIKKQGIPEENVDLAIMSAKYGLIRRDTKIPNYNVKMDKEIANNLLNDPTQVARIKNTIAGYDEVVVEGSDLYKSVIKEAAGDAPIKDFKLDFKKAVEAGEIDPAGGYGSGRQKQSVGKFIRSNTPQDVYHYTQADVPPTVFDVNKLSPYDPLSALGLHVSTNPKAAAERFAALKTSSEVNTLYRSGMPLEDALKKGVETGPPMQPISGNQGLDASGSFIPTKTYGSSMPLKADLSKPFLNPETNKPFTESELFRFTETPPDDFVDFVTDSTVQNAEMIRKKLAEGGFTHIPYVNDFEAKGDLSMIMLIDRPKDSKAVLKGKFGKNDPRERTNPDIMKAEGGVVSLKEKAVNMNRGPRGIESYIQYMKDGGEPKYEEGQGLGDVEMRADLEPYLYGNPLARLGYELYKEGKIDLEGVVLGSMESPSTYGLFSDDRGEIGYIANQREDAPDPLRILTHELAHAAVDYIEGKNQAGKPGFNKYGNVDYEESMIRGGDVLIDRRSPSGEKLAQNYFGRLKPTTKDMKKFMNVSKVAQKALDEKGLSPETIAEGDTGFYGMSGNRLLSGTDKLRRFFLMDPQRNVNNYLNLTGEDIRKAEGGVIGLKDKAVKMHRDMIR